MTTTSLDELLTHAPWLRRLATQLVRDAAAADDLAQEVWLAAMKDAPATLRHPKAWLATVARSLAFTGVRSAKRRKARELSRGVGPDAAPADDVVAEAERERDVARRVLALPEPYRTVVLMRFYRDQRPSEIARELGRPVATVKVQLQRGLERLRQDLDREYGGSAKWCALFAPLLLQRSTAGALASSVVAWSIVIGLGLIAWRMGGAAPAATAPVSIAAATPSETPAIEAASDVLTLSAQRESAPAEAGEPEFATASTPPPRWKERTLAPLRGRLASFDGTALGGVVVAVQDRGRLRLADEARSALVAKNFWLAIPQSLRDPTRVESSVLNAFLEAHFEDPRDARELLLGRALEPETAVTGADGSFEFLTSDSSSEVALRDPALVMVGWRRDPASDAGLDRLWIAVPARRLEVQCLDPRRIPVVGQEVELRARLSDPADPNSPGLSAVAQVLTSDADGRIVFERAPQCAVQLSTTFLDVVLQIDDAPPTGYEPWRVELIVPLAATTWKLTGVALRPDGMPARFGTVHFAGAKANVSADGRFELDTPFLGPDDSLALVEPGFDPLLVERFGARFAAQVRSLDIGELRLPDTRHELSGVVVDDNGQPAIGARVNFADPTRLPGLGAMETIESLSGGLSLGSLVTDHEGRFRLTGLLDREYTLNVEHFGARASVGPFRVGERDVLVRLEPH